MKRMFKRMLVRMLFNKRQRIVIWNALNYSNHRYIRRGNVNGAVMVKTVINEINPFMGVDTMTFTAKEVNGIVKSVSENVAKAVRKSEQKREEAKQRGIAVGTVISREKCEACDHKDQCIVYDACFGNNAPAPEDHTDADLTQQEAEEKGLVEKKEEETASGDATSSEQSRGEAETQEPAASAE